MKSGAAKGDGPRAQDGKRFLRPYGSYTLAEAAETLGYHGGHGAVVMILRKAGVPLIRLKPKNGSVRNYVMKDDLEAYIEANKAEIAARCLKNGTLK